MTGNFEIKLKPSPSNKVETQISSQQKQEKKNAAANPCWKNLNFIWHNKL